MPSVVTRVEPGRGEGWIRLAALVRERVPVAEVDGIWVFRTLRRGGQDWGTAILSRVDGDRRRIYTASFVHTVKGKTRGAFEADVVEVGSGPVDALEDLLALVPKRADDEPPVAIAVAGWFGEGGGGGGEVAPGPG
jgi:hypothetical protein